MKLFGKPKLFVSIFLMLLLTSSIPFFFMGIISYNSFSSSLKKYIQDKLIVISNSRQEILGQTLDKISLDVSVKAAQPSLSKAFEQLSRAFEQRGVQSEEYRLADAQYRESFYRYFDADPFLDDVLLISAKGNVIFSALRKKDFGQNVFHSTFGSPALTDLARKINMFLSTVTSDFDFYPPSNQPALFIGAPVFGETRFLGAIVFRFKPEMLYQFAQNYFELPKTGEIVFVKKEGDDIILATPTRFRRDVSINKKIRFGPRIALAAQKAIIGETGLGVTVDYLGDAVLARWQYVPQLRWGMVVKVRLAEVFAPIYKLRNLYLIIFIVVIGLLLWVSFIVAQRISHPIETVRDGLGIIGSGDLGYRINLNRDDEIGELADDIDKTTAKLKNITASRDELDKIKKELERSNKDLEQYAYVASHDLQEPLRMITSYVQLLERKYKSHLDDAADKYIGYVVDGAERMQGFINDLLQYSRVGQNFQPFTMINLNDILKTALRNLELVINEKKAVITRDELPTIMGDKIWLTHLFQNLINNAVKFQDNKVPRVHIGAQEHKEEWVFSVSDNGIGIDDQYKDRLFVIFQRLHTRDKYPGSGIGLAVCKKIVDFYGGRIWVASQLGKGSTFYFSLPKVSNHKKETVSTEG